MSKLACALFLVVLATFVNGWDGSFSIYNECDTNILVRMEITGDIYNDMALDMETEGKLGCDYVWYTIYAYTSNDSEYLCDTGTPVSEYCGADIVVKGNKTIGYTCGE